MGYSRSLFSSFSSLLQVQLTANNCFFIKNTPVSTQTWVLWCSKQLLGQQYNHKCQDCVSFFVITSILSHLCMCVFVCGCFSGQYLVTERWPQHDSRVIIYDCRESIRMPAEQNSNSSTNKQTSVPPSECNVQCFTCNILVTVAKLLRFKNAMRRWSIQKKNNSWVVSFK